MTTTPHFPVPQNLAEHTALELHALVRNMEEWFARFHVGAGAHVIIDDRGSAVPSVVVSRAKGMSLQVEAGDMLVIDLEASDPEHQLRFATMEEEDQLRTPEATQPPPEPSDFHLIFQRVNGDLGEAIITADTVTGDENYLMFLKDNAIVQSLPHRSVVEFNQVSVHGDNTRPVDGTPVPLSTAERAGRNKFMP